MCGAIVACTEPGATLANHEFELVETLVMTTSPCASLSSSDFNGGRYRLAMFSLLGLCWTGLASCMTLPTQSGLVNDSGSLVDDDDDDESDEMELGLTASHPSAAFRVNRIFAQHPGVRKFLGCKDITGPTLPGVPAHCFWPIGQDR